MGRKSRFNLPGIPQHVIQRGHNREPCFFAEADYLRYLEDLAQACETYPCYVHAYVLMTNHVHLLITPLVEYGIPQMMQSLGRRYVRYINHSYQRSGTLWEGRYKASLVDSQHYLLSCMRYIELNPIRANMASQPGEYRWSSYKLNGHGKPDATLRPHPLYLQLGQNEESRCHAYRELFRNTIDNALLHEIRDAVNLELVLGRGRFKDRIEAMTKRQTRPGQSGRPRIEDEEGVYFVY